MVVRPRGKGCVSCDALAPPSLALSRKPDEESPIAAPLRQTNVLGKDIPDAAAYLRRRTPSLTGYRQFTGNSAVWVSAFLYTLRRMGHI